MSEKRSEYLEAVRQEFADAAREDLLKQIAFCWRKQDLQAKRIGQEQNVRCRVESHVRL